MNCQSYRALTGRFNWWKGRDSNPRPRHYEHDEAQQSTTESRKTPATTRVSQRQGREAGRLSCPVAILFATWKSLHCRRQTGHSDDPCLMDVRQGALGECRSNEGRRRVARSRRTLRHDSRPSCMNAIRGPCPRSPVPSRQRRCLARRRPDRSLPLVSVQSPLAM